MFHFKLRFGLFIFAPIIVMKFSVEQKPENVFEIEAEVYYDDYKDKVNAKFADYKKNLQLPGFRKGKMPSTLGKNQKERIIFEEADAIIHQRFKSYLKENKIELFLSPISIPMLNRNKKHKYPEFRYKVTFQAKPKIEFDLSLIKGVVRYEIEIEEENIDEDILRIRHLNVVQKVADNFDTPDNLVFQLAPITKNPGLPKSILIQYKDIEHDDYKKLLLNNRESGTLVNLPCQFVLGDGLEDYNLIHHNQKLSPKDTIKLKMEKVLERNLPEITIEMVYKEYDDLKLGDIGTDIEIRDLIREALKLLAIENSSDMNYYDVISELKKRYKLNISREFCKSWVLLNIETLDPYDKELWGDTEDNNDNPDPERVEDLTDDSMNRQGEFLIAQRLSEQLNYKDSTDKNLYEKEFRRAMEFRLQYSRDIALDASGNIKKDWIESNWKFFDSRARAVIYFDIICRYIVQEKLYRTEKITLNNFHDKMAKYKRIAKHTYR